MDTPPKIKPTNENENANAKPASGQPQPSSFDLDIRTVLVLVVVIAIGIIGFVVYHFNTTRRLEQAGNNARLEATRVQAEAELQRTKGAEGAKLAVAVGHQEELRLRVRNNTNARGNLLKQVAQLQADAASLSTNEQGKTVALHPDLVAQARRCYERDLGELPDRDEIITKIESSRRIGQQLLELAGTQFNPPAEMSVTLQDQGLWAESAARKTGQLQKTLESLVREAKIKVASSPVDAGTPTLETAIRNLTLSESAQRQRTMVEVTTKATDVATINLANAEADRILQGAKLKVDKMIKEGEEGIAKQKREIEDMLAQAKIAQAKGEVAKQEKEEEARKVKLRAKATEPAVKALLAPFITAGRWRPKGDTYDPKPHSLTVLKSWGALDQTIIGLQKLIDIACSLRDKERPRWGFGGDHKTYRLSPEQMKQATDAQKLLIELGPVLGELGVLDP
jgi:hypothetical protein